MTKIKKIPNMTFQDYCKSQGLEDQELDRLLQAKMLIESGISTDVKKKQKADLLDMLEQEYFGMIREGKIGKIADNSYSVVAA